MCSINKSEQIYQQAKTMEEKRLHTEYFLHLFLIFFNIFDINNSSILSILNCKPVLEWFSCSKRIAPQNLQELSEK